MGLVQGFLGLMLDHARIGGLAPAEPAEPILEEETKRGVVGPSFALKKEREREKQRRRERGRGREGGRETAALNGASA